MKRMLGAAAVCVAMLALHAPLHAHQPSESYLRISPAHDDSAWVIRWHISVLDLEHAVGVDADGDGAITWGELKARRSAVEEYAFAHIAVLAGETPCAKTPSQFRVEDRGDGHYVVLDAATDCSPTSGTLAVRYDLLFELDPTHRGLLVLDDGSAASPTILSPAERVFKAGAQAPSGGGTFARFVGEGIRHIAIGYDHIAFIVLLLLPAGLTRRQGVLAPASGAGIVVVEILKVVTAFTIAHSLTLGLAASGLLTLPARLIEAAIAASVVLAALANLWPKSHDYRWVIAFSFGLVHGFGFANVLGELDLRGMDLAVPLAAFNVGVEIGQLVIAAAALPLLLIMRRHTVYRRWVIPACSAAIALVASLWLLDRVSA